MLSLVPCPDPSAWRGLSTFPFPSAAESQPLACTYHHSPQHQERGSSLPSSTRHGRSQTSQPDLLLCCAWIWGSPGRRFIPVAATQVSESWPDGNGGEVNNCNFQQWRSHLPPGSSYGFGLLFLFALLYPLQYTCSVSRWRPHKVDKRMVLEYTHGLFIT